MNEEEKKVVERIEGAFYSDLGKGINKFQKITLYEDAIRDVRILLNLLEKLQKENEELNEKILDNAGIYQLGFKDGEESYIKKVKDKIRKNEEIIDISNDGDLIHELYQKNKVYEELLESEK